MASLAKRFKELSSKYGRVAIGVHLSISAFCFTSCYVAVKSSLDVEGVLGRIGLFKGDKEERVATVEDRIHSVEENIERLKGLGHHEESPADHEHPKSDGQDKANAEPALDKVKKGVLDGGGALALAFLCNKALFPVRVPVTLALTPRVHRFLRSRGFRV